MTAHWNAEVGQWILTREDGTTFPLDPVVIADQAYERALHRINKARIEAATRRIMLYTAMLAARSVAQLTQDAPAPWVVNPA